VAKKAKPDMTAIMRRTMVVPFLMAAMGEVRAERAQAQRRPAYRVEGSSIVWRSGLRAEIPARQQDFVAFLQEYTWRSRTAPDGAAQTKLRDERDAR
jgi:hypothetical protein